MDVQHEVLIAGLTQIGASFYKFFLENEGINLEEFYTEIVGDTLPRRYFDILISAMVDSNYITITHDKLIYTIKS